jgi:DnaJ-domain-containing protein 1
MGAKRYEMRSAEDRERRRLATHQATKCWCGNVARHGETWCGLHEPQPEPDMKDVLRAIMEACNDNMPDDAYVIAKTALERLERAEND